MMKRWWWLTLEERQRKYREIQEKQLESMTPKEPKKRNPYRRGAKAYLASFDVGETKVFHNDLNWDSLRSIACHMKKDFGCEFTFNKSGVTRYITRTK